jgi:hypothetical protein
MEQVELFQLASITRDEGLRLHSHAVARSIVIYSTYLDRVSSTQRVFDLQVGKKEVRMCRKRLRQECRECEKNTKSCLHALEMERKCYC